jgi:hypothetical protein
LLSYHGGLLVQAEGGVGGHVVTQFRIGTAWPFLSCDGLPNVLREGGELLLSGRMQAPLSCTAIFLADGSEGNSPKNLNRLGGRLRLPLPAKVNPTSLRGAQLDFFDRPEGFGPLTLAPSQPN